MNTEQLTLLPAEMPGAESKTLNWGSSKIKTITSLVLKTNKNQPFFNVVSCTAVTTDGNAVWVLLPFSAVPKYYGLNGTALGRVRGFIMNRAVKQHVYLRDNGLLDAITLVGVRNRKDQTVKAEAPVLVI